METFLIPLTNFPQDFEITLKGIAYRFVCRWNDATDGGWFLDIYLAESVTPLVANVPLITGGNCLAGLEYLGIGGELRVRTDGDEFAVPTYTNLGVESNLYFVTEVA